MNPTTAAGAEPAATKLGLAARQQLHVRLTGRLIQFLYEQPSYSATWGESYRSPKVAELNAQAGVGIARSLHCLRLAVDLQVFKNGEYLTTDADGIYEKLGTFWESLNPLCRWGGRFTTRDYDHFSITWDGVS